MSAGALGLRRRARAARAARSAAPARLARPGSDAERRHLDVLAHREAPKRAAVLERAREPGPRAAVRAPAGDLAARRARPSPRRGGRTR